MTDTANQKLQTKERGDKIAYQIAESYMHRLHARELVNQSQRMRGDALRMREDALRMRLFICTDIEMLTEVYCQQFEMLDAEARDKSNSIDGYPSIK